MSNTGKILATIVMASALAAGCTTDPVTGQVKPMKTATYGLGGAATCGVIGGLLGGKKDALAAAAVCGAVGAGVGGYMDYQEKLLRDQLASTPVEVQRQGNEIRLTLPENVTFATNSSTLNPSASYSLDRISGILAQYNETRVVVSGFTDSTGSDRINEPLSQRRADAVRAYLIRSGVAPQRIIAQGLGSSAPIASNATAAGRQQNRRVEIKIIPNA